MIGEARTKVRGEEGREEGSASFLCPSPPFEEEIPRADLN